MDANPPTGDDLTKMIVSMRQNVLQRTTTDRPRKSRFHFGLIIGLVVLLGVGTASGAVALGLVPQPFAAPVPATPTPSPSAPAPTPAPTTIAPASPLSTAPSAVALTTPAACSGLVDSADSTRLFGTAPLQQVRPVRAGSTASPQPVPKDPGHAFYTAASLYCIWADPRSDVSYLSVEMGTAAPSETAANVADLAAQGYTCSEVDGGESCQQITRNAEYPVDDTSTFFVSGDTWIQIKQTNFPTNNLLGAIVDHLSR